jgi:hypothetical protein
MFGLRGVRRAIYSGGDQGKAILSGHDDLPELLQRDGRKAGFLFCKGI